MAVIIDTFEVVSEAASAAPGTSATNNAENPSSSIKPMDIEAVLEYHDLRSDRLRAH